MNSVYTTYLVGGAVRDELLGIPITEYDWVVVGADPATLERAGFIPVGKDFPVFLHPQTKEEYALARTERKVARGYHGFTWFADPSITLEQDLQRRDLTVNAMAKSPTGEVIDPFGGQRDIQTRLLRHVSPAFAEDPVRILRCARFAARFHPLGFTIAQETMDLMKTMVQQGEADALVAERVWKETHKALTTRTPSIFFKTLLRCGALQKVLPEIVSLIHKSTSPLLSAIDRQLPAKIKFALLLGEVSPDLIISACQRLRVPKEYTDLARLSVIFFTAYQHFQTASPKENLDFFCQADIFRKYDRFLDLLLIWQQRAPLSPEQHTKLLTQSRHIQSLNARTLLAKNPNLTGIAVGQALYQARLQYLTLQDQ